MDTIEVWMTKAMNMEAFEQIWICLNDTDLEKHRSQKQHSVMLIF